MTPKRLGELVFPILAFAYASHAVYEQLAGDYRIETIYYSLLLAAPVLALALAAVIQTARRPAEAGEAAAAPPFFQTYRIPLMLLALATVLVLSLNFVGYLIGFTVFLVAALWLLRVRSPRKLAGISIGTVLVLHFIFIGWLHMSLPRGLLASLPIY